MLKYISSFPIIFLSTTIFRGNIAWLCINIKWFRFGIILLFTNTFRGNISWLCLNIMFVLRCKYVIQIVNWKIGKLCILTKFNLEARFDQTERICILLKYHLIKKKEEECNDYFCFFTILWFLVAFNLEMHVIKPFFEVIYICI